MSGDDGRARRDGDLVMVAAHDGRISADSIPRWLMAMQADSEGTRKVLASLTSIDFDSLGVDPAASRAGEMMQEAMIRRGYAAPPTKTVTAAAATPSRFDLPDVPDSTTYDSAGMPIPEMPAPVRLVSGKDPNTWTDEERMNHFRRSLWSGNAAVRESIPPAPGSAGWHIPSPNQVSIPVQHPDGSVEWVENPNYVCKG